MQLFFSIIIFLIMCIKLKKRHIFRVNSQYYKVEIIIIKGLTYIV